jgi:low temperature requirement protein LtrA
MSSQRPVSDEERAEPKPSAPNAGQRTLRLRVGEEGERHATWLELFFDLVFVVAIAALASFLHDNLTVDGFLGFALLFVPVGWAWMSFAYYATSTTPTTPYSGCSCWRGCRPWAALAVNIGALGGESTGFVVTNVVLRLLLVGSYAWAWKGSTEGCPTSASYAAGFTAGTVIGRPRCSRRSPAATASGRLRS